MRQNSPCNLKRILKIPPASAVLLRISLAVRKQRHISIGRGQGNRITIGRGIPLDLLHSNYKIPCAELTPYNLKRIVRTGFSIFTMFKIHRLRRFLQIRCMESLRPALSPSAFLSPSESSAAYPSGGGRGNRITTGRGLSRILTANKFLIQPL